MQGGVLAGPFQLEAATIPERSSDILNIARTVHRLSISQTEAVQSVEYLGALRLGQEFDQFGLEMLVMPC